MGYGHLGVIPLPTTGDSYEQPQVNFYSGYKGQNRGDGEPIGAYRQIEFLVFGGTRFKEREPNANEYSNRCIKLTIKPNSDTYELTYLPGAKLACPDKFFNNMQVKCDLNQNIVTVLGNRAVHRINTGKRNVAHLKWKKPKMELGYGQVLEKCDWRNTLTRR